MHARYLHDVIDATLMHVTPRVLGQTENVCISLTR